MTTQTLIRQGREYRQISEYQLSQAEQTDQLIVEGYALTFDQPTIMLESGDIQYKEMIDRGALNQTDMTDVILNYDHNGKVMARTRNKTLELNVDERGLFVRARLDGTEEGRKLYEEIKGGYIDRMSFSFTVATETYDQQNRTRIITGIRRIYDVSAVSFPAYDTTSIQARSYLEAEADREQKALASANLRRKLMLRTFTF